MPSDPTTKDLIEAARESRTPCAIRHAPGRCSHCDIHALADRLEEVWEEREKRSGLAGGLLYQMEGLREPSDPEPARMPCLECGEDMLDDRDGMTGARWFCANGHRAICIYPTEGPKPEDDPEPGLWRLVKVLARDGDEAESTLARALLDLRKWHEALRRDYLDWSIALNRKFSDRLTTLEGHADRGSEAEAELRGRVTTLEYREEAGRRTRIELLNDRDSLVERVERLEARADG